MKPSYGTQYKQLLAQAYAAKIKQAAYKPRAINKRAALHLMQNPRLRELLYKRAGFWGNVGTALAMATPFGFLATQKGRQWAGKGLKALGGLYGAGAKGLGAVGKFGAGLAGKFYGGALKGLGTLTGSTTLSNWGNNVQSGFNAIGNGIGNAGNAVGNFLSGGGAAAGGGEATPAAGTTNSSANSSGSGGDSGVINDSAEG